VAVGSAVAGAAGAGVGSSAGAALVASATEMAPSAARTSAAAGTAVGVGAGSGVATAVAVGGTTGAGAGVGVGRTVAVGRTNGAVVAIGVGAGALGITSGGDESASEGIPTNDDVASPAFTEFDDSDRNEFTNRRTSRPAIAVIATRSARACFGEALRRRGIDTGNRQADSVTER